MMRYDDEMDWKILAIGIYFSIMIDIIIGGVICALDKA